MYKVCIFAGTTEGRELAEYLCRNGIAVTACVATEYGETLLTPSENLTVSAGRLPPDEILKLLSSENFDIVVDATHPYAVSITESIFGACTSSGTEYLRLLRPASELPEDAVFADSAEQAVQFLASVPGKVLLTVGSKELPNFAKLPDAADRMYARVLPMQSSLAICQECGFLPAHIIAMQGPFSEEMNVALLRTTGAVWLVTKDGGNAGGFAEKTAAVRKAGARLLVIGRPPQREGVSYPEAADLLAERFGILRRPDVFIVGIGPGSSGAMTEEVRQIISDVDCLIGAERMLGCSNGKPTFCEISPDRIADVVFGHREFSKFAVVMSGDSGFFSGTKKLLPLLKEAQVQVLPGLSSLSYLCARLQTSYEDVCTVSLHGRKGSILPAVRRNARVFSLVGGRDGVSALCRDLVQAGYEDARVSVGSRLSYLDEEIITGTALSLSDRLFPALSAVLIEHDHAIPATCSGLPDSDFQRGGSSEGIVPMTKREIRAVSLSMLQLNVDSICWDIGAGTGSVSIEMALQAYAGHVYAVEKKEAALELLQDNICRFHAENVTVVPGLAPECCDVLPAPTHIFVGGSSGNMEQILSAALAKNPHVRIVAAAIALETVAELESCMKIFPFTTAEAVCINASRSRKAGPYHLMTAQNPVYIFTMQAEGEKQ